MGCKKCLLFFCFEPTNNLFWCLLVPKWVNLWTIIPHSAPLCCQWFYMLFWCPPYSHLFWDKHSFFIWKIFHTFTKACLLFLHLLHYGTFKAGNRSRIGIWNVWKSSNIGELVVISYYLKQSQASLHMLWLSWDEHMSVNSFMCAYITDLVWVRTSALLFWCPFQALKLRFELWN